MELLTERLLPFAREHIVPIVLCLLGLICLDFGMVSLFTATGSEEELTFKPVQKDVSTKNNPEAKQDKKILVDVSGAVTNPGVYVLTSDSRVQDAIVAAGGMAGTVDSAKVAQNLNLAAPLTDGAKLYIPVAGEQMVTSSGGSTNSSAASKAVAGTSTALININAADESELDTLPGVGEVTAGKIIDNRPYQNIQELLDKEVVGQATFEKIKESISVY
ncbi:MAG: ComEA family DNA-binding protein [Candidatus Levybacteria bacterium]|nr:ComEA family DNA-binding protein [Candidatus Levybacteria bacterium]